MNEQERTFFAALSRDRAESAEMLEKPSMRGIKNSVVEKYSDQAHFIYELLQNADDAHATIARFILEPTRLIFAHNGTRLFSVSDPANEDNDLRDGLLGDINAITSIANSDKTREASIGKFGVGFKAVFQYTSTPYIYDRNFRFKIERFIVLNLSSSVQSRNTQRSERQQRFPEPEVVILIRTAPRQPPRSGCLGRLSGKCYTGKSTGLVEACLIPIAVGGSSTAFSRRSVKTGGNRNVSPDFVSCVS